MSGASTMAAAFRNTDPLERLGGEARAPRGAAGLGINDERKRP